MDSQEIVLNVSRVEFGIFGNDEVLRNSVVNVAYSDTYENNTPKIGGLIDPRMGVTDQFMNCVTCKENFLQCPGHFGHCSLTEPVFHWGFMQYVKNILSCICLKSCKILIPLDELNKKIITKSRRARFTEIKNLCQAVKVSPFSGIPVPKISVDVKRHSGLINLVAEYQVNANNDALISELMNGGDPNALQKPTIESISDSKKKIRHILTAADCMYILKNISQQDCDILGIENPAGMVISVFPMPPVAIRPSIRGDFLSQGYAEHGTTHKLADIVKFNAKLIKEKERSLTVPDNQRYLETYQQCLQYHCATYFDNESMSLPRCELKSGSGNAAKSITYRLKGGKTSRIRWNLQGKRVDYSARTVITSDPNNDLDELGVPIKIAKVITFPETVTPYNIERLHDLVRSGRNKYPGANFVDNTGVIGPNGKPVRTDLRYRNRDIRLRYGWVVHRHLCDGDIVLFNRQPSLHKMSMMAHRVRVINDPNLITFRMNVTATEPYNADFDGDEMNLFAPQSEMAREELRRLADIKNHIISPKDSSPIVNLKQDARLGTYCFTQDGYEMDWKEAMCLLTQTSALSKLLDGNIKLKKSGKYSGKEIISMLIPKRINVENPKILIRNGEVVKGVVGKHEIGGSKNSIPHLITDGYNKRRASEFMDDIQRITNSWLMMYGGFTVGLGDAIIDPKVTKDIQNNINTKILESCNLLTETEDKQMIDRVHFEEFMYRELSILLNQQIKILEKHIPSKNNLYVMVESGSKGKWQNIGLIMGCIGQSPFESKLVPKKLNHRSLPYFAKHDDRPAARGFITRPYIDGIDPIEFFYNMQHGRNGLIDTAIKTADTGYIQRRTIKATEDVYEAYDMTVRNASGGIVQMVYGDSGYDPSKQMEYKCSLILMDNDTVAKTYGFTPEEAKLHGVSDSLNEEIVGSMIRDRDALRRIQADALMNSMVIENRFYLPFHLIRVVQYHMNNKKDSVSSTKKKLKAEDILAVIDNFFSASITQLTALSQNQKGNKKSIKYMNDQRHKTLFKILVRECISPKKVLVDYKMSRNQFESMMDELVNSYNRNMIQPCEMVGILAAQSIGEPLTQFTLNTFHQSGMAEMGNLSAIGRFKELISFTRNVKQPIMKIYLLPHLCNDEKRARRLLNTIENTLLDDIIMSCKVLWDTTSGPKDIRELFTIVGPSVTDQEMLGLSAPWVISFEIDRMAMLRKELDLMTIKLNFVRFWEEVMFDQKGYKRKEKDLLSLVNSLYIYSTAENDKDSCTIYVRVDFKEYRMGYLAELVYFLRDKFRVKGIIGVVKALCKQEIKKSFDSKSGALVEGNEYVIMVEASTANIMRQIIMLDDIDVSRTTVSDVFTVYQLMGIEATRTSLIHEMNNVFSSQGHTINHQHISILIDLMTHNANVTSVNRYGISKLDTDPLSRASFEKTVDQLLQAAVFKEVDSANSVSSRIMLGRAIRGGTGMISLIPDIDRLRNTTYRENRYLMELDTSEIVPLKPDPYILNELMSL